MPFRRFGVLVVAGLVGCGAPQSSPPAAAPKPSAEVLATPAPEAVPEPPLTELVTGALAPVQAESIGLDLRASAVGPEFETLKFTFQVRTGMRIEPTDVVDVPGAIFAVVTYGSGADRIVWVRRPSAMAGTAVSGNLYSSAAHGPGVLRPLRAKAGPAPKASSAPELEAESLKALATSAGVNRYWRSPFDSFMQRRLNEMATKPVRIAPGASGRPLPVESSDLSRLMDTTTGRAAIQLAIQNENGLALGLRSEPRKLPLAAAKAPELPRANYGDMLAMLHSTAPVEPLAAAAPADFWFLRAKSFGAFLDLLDLTESFGEPTADILAKRADDRGTTARYTAELALERTELARVLGPSVIDSVAVVGSDPYVHDGTDLTLLFKVTAAPLFEASLTKALKKFAAEHGGVTTKSAAYEGVTIRTARSADGRVRQERASVAGLELVSNSPAAIRRVIAAALGKTPRLADEPDFRFLTARDAGTPDDVLAYLSDRFVTTVIGPAQKIAQARRELALAELSTPPFAALLFGRLNGRSPKDDRELLKGGELLSAELRHADGSPIAWQPGKPASSRWGTTTHLEPLIDLPPVEKISESEQRSYEWFSNDYRMLWSEYVDPVIVRIGHGRDAPGRFDVALRALPLLRSENRDILEMVGSARVEAPPLDTGLRWVLALGKDASFRRELEGQASFLGQSLKLDWIGDSVRIGLADRAELTAIARAFVKENLEAPSDKEEREDPFDAIRDLPLYAVIEVKNRVGAIVALGMLRKLADGFAHEMLEWRSGGKHRDIPITDIAILPSGLLRTGGHLYYALCPKGLIFSMHRAVLESVIDEELDGRAPHGVADPRGTGSDQLVVELGTKKDGALLRTLGWLTMSELVTETQSKSDAEAILRGAPESRASDDAFRTAARAAFGSVPLTPDGNVYRYSKEGLLDPVRGTAYAPIFPTTPVPGSPLARVLARFERFKSGIAFDPEPGSGTRGAETRSFSAKFSLDLR